MKGFCENIEQLTTSNTNFRHVLYTGKHLQLVLMSIPVGGEIGLEIHSENDQFFRVDAGSGMCIINGNEYQITDGTAIVVPAGAQHNIINTSESEALQLYTIYAPPHHQDGVIRATKALADADEPEFDGVTTE